MTKRTKTAITAALALLLALSMAACALPSPVPVNDGAPTVAQDFVPSQTTTEETNSAYAVDTVDMAGNAVQLAAYPERIVVLDPGDCEILFAIGAGSVVVGRTASCDYPLNETSVIPYVTTNNEIDADLVQSGHALVEQQLLGADAVGAGGGRVHADRGLHAHFLLRLTGCPAFCHSIMPPRRL